MKKTLITFIIFGFALFLPQIAFAGLSEGCAPAVDCPSGEDYYTQSGISDCHSHVESLTGAPPSCFSLFGAPSSGKEWKFSCSSGCYQSTIPLCSTPDVNIGTDVPCCGNNTTVKYNGTKWVCVPGVYLDVIGDPGYKLGVDGIAYFTGNVGIGTTTPNYALDVVDNGGGVGDDAFSEFNSRARFGYDGTRSAAVVHGISGKNVVFDANGSEQMRITSGGDVGIGTTSPEVKLDVAGDIELNDNMLISNYVSSSNIDHLWHDDSPNRWYFNSDTTGKNDKATSGVAARGFYLRDWDDATIGSNDDTYRLLGRDGAWMFYNGGVVVGNYANDTWSDLADGTLIVEGKVGIGTDTPLEKLHVEDSDTAYHSEVAEFHNTANHVYADAIAVHIRSDFTDTGTQNDFIKFLQGNGGLQIDSIRGDNAGGTQYTGKAQGTYSDRRMKENIQDYDEGALDLISTFRPVTFNFIKGTNPDLTRFGFIAQEMLDKYPQAINFGDPLPDVPEDELPLLRFDYGELAPLLTAAIQEQQQIIEDLKSRLEILENNLK